jgi:hypothetical protein
VARRGGRWSRSYGGSRTHSHEVGAKHRGKLTNRRAQYEMLEQKKNYLKNASETNR